MDEITLKECPFCGGVAEFEHYGGGLTTRFSLVKCTFCGAKTADFAISTSYAADAVAANAWNIRTEGTQNDKTS